MKWDTPSAIRGRINKGVLVLLVCMLILILTDHDWWAIVFAIATVAVFIGGVRAMEDAADAPD